MPKNENLPTLKTIHDELKQQPATKRDKVLELLGVNTQQTFHDIINGNRKVKPIEKAAIAEVYGRKPEEIDWQDEIKPIA